MYYYHLVHLCFSVSPFRLPLNYGYQFVDQNGQTFLWSKSHFCIVTQLDFQTKVLSWSSFSSFLLGIWRLLDHLHYNRGQRDGDKFTKLSKTGFLWTVLQLIFCGVLPKCVKIWLLDGQLGTCHQIQAFQLFLKIY